MGLLYVGLEVWHTQIAPHRVLITLLMTLLGDPTTNCRILLPPTPDRAVLFFHVQKAPISPGRRRVLAVGRKVREPRARQGRVPMRIGPVLAGVLVPLEPHAAVPGELGLKGFQET